MKILIATFPYCGASDLAMALSSDLGLKYFQDPLDHTVPLTVNHPMEQLIKPGETVYPVRIPRGYNIHHYNWVDSSDGYKELEGYNFPDDVPNNTVITHNVKWHNLPNNYTEEQFLDIFMDKFDHVICLGASNPEINWKSHCASLAQVKEDNYLWRKWALEQDFYNEYEDSMLDEDLKLKHEEAQAWLYNYATYQGFTFVDRDEIFGYQHNDTIEKCAANIDKLNIPDMPVFEWDNDIQSVTLDSIHSKLRWMGSQGCKY